MEKLFAKTFSASPTAHLVESVVKQVPRFVEVCVEELGCREHFLREKSLDLINEASFALVDGNITLLFNTPKLVDTLIALASRSTTASGVEAVASVSACVVLCRLAPRNVIRAINTPGYLEVLCAFLVPDGTMQQACCVSSIAVMSLAQARLVLVGTPKLVERLVAAVSSPRTSVSVKTDALTALGNFCMIAQNHTRLLDVPDFFSAVVGAAEKVADPKVGQVGVNLLMNFACAEGASPEHLSQMCSTEGIVHVLMRLFLNDPTRESRVDAYSVLKTCLDKVPGFQHSLINTPGFVDAALRAGSGGAAHQDVPERAWSLLQNVVAKSDENRVRVVQVPNIVPLAMDAVQNGAAQMTKRNALAFLSTLCGAQRVARVILKTPGLLDLLLATASSAAGDDPSIQHGSVIALCNLALGREGLLLMLKMKGSDVPGALFAAATNGHLEQKTREEAWSGLSWLAEFKPFRSAVLRVDGLLDAALSVVVEPKPKVRRHVFFMLAFLCMDSEETRVKVLRSKRTLRLAVHAFSVASFEGAAALDLLFALAKEAGPPDTKRLLVVEHDLAQACTNLMLHTSSVAGRVRLLELLRLLAETEENRTTIARDGRWKVQLFSGTERQEFDLANVMAWRVFLELSMSSEAAKFLRDEVDVAGASGSCFARLAAANVLGWDLERLARVGVTSTSLVEGLLLFFRSSFADEAPRCDLEHALVMLSRMCGDGFRDVLATSRLSLQVCLARSLAMALAEGNERRVGMVVRAARTVLGVVRSVRSRVDHVDPLLVSSLSVVVARFSGHGVGLGAPALRRDALDALALLNS